MDVKKQAISGFFWSSIQLFGNQGVTFIVTIILSRILMPSEFGLIAMLGVFLHLGTAFINSGLTTSLIRTHEPDEEDFSTVFYFNLLGSIIIYVLIFLSAPLIASFYKQLELTYIVRVYSITFIVNAFSTVQQTKLIKMLDFKTLTKVSVPSAVFSGIIGIILANLNYGVWSLVWSAISLSVFSTIQLWYWSKWRPIMTFNKEKFNYHFSYGVKLLFSSILDILFTNAYTIVIGKFYAPSLVGYYNRADSLQMLPVGNISSIVTKVTFPLFSSIQDDDIRLKNIYKRIMQMVVFLVAPILIFMAVLAEPLFRFLFTEKWLPAVPYFQILCLNGILYPIHSYNLQILNIKGRSDLFLKLEIIKKILTIGIILISFSFGIFGLLYGSVITSIICFLINTHYSGKFLHYTAWQQTKDLLPIIILSVVIGAMIYLLDLYLMYYLFYDFSRLLIGGLAGLLLYTVFSNFLKISSLTEILTIIQRK